MSANAETVPQTSAPPKRRLRNFLLDSRFQLKYTGMVVAATVVVAGVLGYFAYDYSRGQTESLTVTMAMQPDLHPEVAADLEGWAEAQDQKVLFAILGGIVILALTMGFTGIIVTHKVVGPSYKMRRLLRNVADGHLKVEGRLRKGDELQELFHAFEQMVVKLRERQAKEVAQLDLAIEKARNSGASDDALADLVSVRDEMQSQLD
jgi:methyl-accepting chemotaxis protein